MDILRRLFGGDEPRSRTAQSRPLSRQMSSDEQAVERYRYLLRTAPPERSKKPMPRRSPD